MIRLSFPKLSLTAALVVGAAFAAGETRASDASKNYSDHVAACGADAGSEKGLNPYDPDAPDGKALQRTYDGEANCVLNSASVKNSHNYAILKKWPNFLETDKDLNNYGACRLVYRSIQATYDYIATMRTRYCEDMETALKIAQNCRSGVPEVGCKKEWQALKNNGDKYRLEIETNSEKLKTLFNWLASTTLSAAKAYDKDKKDIADAEKSGTFRPEDSQCTEAKAGLKASNGNKLVCKDYKSALTGVERKGKEAVRYKGFSPLLPGKPPAPGQLIVEEYDAHLMANSYLSLLTDYFSHTKNVLAEAALNLDGELAEAEKRDRPKAVNGENFGNTTSGLTGLVTGAKGMAQPSALSSAGGPNPLALAAVGAAGVMAAGNFGGSSSRSGAREAPAESVNRPETANLGEKPERGGGGGNGSPVGGGNTFKPGADDTASAGGDAAPIDFATVGTSRDPAGKSGLEGKPASSGPVGGGDGAKSEDTFGVFQQKLEPKPIPKTSASNPAGEVANLLGQMKSLFNFDEPPATNEFAGPGHGGAPANGALPPFVGAEGEMPPIDESGANQEMAGETSSGEEANPGEEVQADPLGKVDVSLFSRVRERHHRSMERGLVLYDLKERVE